MSKPIITVFGATGAQGGSVAKIFLGDTKLREQWAVRAVTRDANKDSAKKLANDGAEVVEADMDDPASIVGAVKGATAVFAVTNYWEKLDKDNEIKQGKAIADAAKAAGVKHFIWSTLPNVSKRTNGKLTGVLHFDSKALVDDHIRAIGLPSTFFNAGYYMANVSGGFRKTDEGGYVFSLPFSSTRPIPVFDAQHDTGKYVAGIVLAGPPPAGEYRTVISAADYMSADDILAAFRSAFPKAGANAAYFQITHEQFKGYLLGQGMPEFAAEELLQNLRLIDEFGYYFGESLAESHKYVYGGKLTTMEEHLKNSKAFEGLE